MNHISRSTTDRGASEAIGFLLIFTMVIAGIGLVTLYGYPMLLQQQTSADQQIMEKNMIVLQNDMKSLAYKTVPFKETSMKIGSGALGVHSSDIVTNGPEFCIAEAGSPCDDFAGFMPNNRTGDLRYQNQGSQEIVSLQNGAVVKKNLVSAGSAMLAEPRWFYDGQTNTLVVNIINITSSSLMERQGVGTIQMELGRTDSEYITVPSRRIDIYYTYSPGTADSKQDYSTAWRTYFGRTLDLNCGASNYPMICTNNNYDIQTLVIKRTNVIIRSL